MLSKDKAAVCVSCVVDGVDHELSMVSSAIARARLIVVVGTWRRVDDALPPSLTTRSVTFRMPLLPR